MPWRESSIMSQKETFVRLALQKSKPFSQLCKEYNISRQAGYLLLQRFEQGGLEGLAERSRAPLSSPFKTSYATEEQILTVRVRHPTWGPRKIRAYLMRQGHHQLPAPSTIACILKRRGFISPEESMKRQALGRFERETPNELWQMDFKGHFQLTSKETCYPLTVLDDHSRFSLGIKACANEQGISVKKQLTAIFEQYGLPLQINVDNGNPWGHSHLLPYTKLVVWLMQLGIKVTHSRPGHPQTNGKEERFHRTLKEDILKRYDLTSFQHAQSVFDQWRDIYNYERPHEALQMRVPADRYQPSAKAMPSALPDLEYSDDAILRKARGNGYVCYKGKEYLIGRAFAGYPIEIKFDELCKEVHLYFGQHKIYTYDLA